MRAPQEDEATDNRQDPMPAALLARIYARRVVELLAAEARQARYSFGYYVLLAACAGLVGTRVLDVVRALA